MRIFIKICKFLLYLLYFLIVAAGIAIVVLLLQGKKLYGIETGSMGSDYPVGSLVVVEKTEFEQFKIDDVITYTVSENTVVTHRLIGIDSENRQFTTKGDANKFADNTPVSYENVIGRVSVCIPIAGYAFFILSTNFGKLMLCIVVLAIVGIYLIVRYAKSPTEEIQAETDAETDEKKADPDNNNVDRDE